MAIRWQDYNEERKDVMMGRTEKGTERINTALTGSR